LSLYVWQLIPIQKEGETLNGTLHFGVTSQVTIEQLQ